MGRYFNGNQVPPIENGVLLNSKKQDVKNHTGNVGSIFLACNSGE